MQIDIAVCSFRRRSILDALESVSRQALPEGESLRVIVAENDDTPALREVIQACAEELGLDLHYVHAPARNISIARNACLDHAKADVLLFMDDDEVAEPDWVRNLLKVWKDTGAGVVFGPSLAVYPAEAPDWMRANSFHSSVPSPNRGVLETGHSGNVLLDRTDPRVREARFNVKFGRTGGEDVDFFFRLHRAGVVMEVAHDAAVHEPVPPAKMSFGWLFRRRYTVGALYGACVAPDSVPKRIRILAMAMAKAAYSGVCALVYPFDASRGSFWIMRASFQAGVVSGTISPPRREFYGVPETGAADRNHNPADQARVGADP